MTNDDLNFKRMFASYLKEINFKLFSFVEVIASIIVSISVHYVISHTKDPIAASTVVINSIFSGSATILGIVVAGFAIYATVADKQFIAFLHRNEALKGLLFPFWLGSIFWAIIICLSLVLNVPGLLFSQITIMNLIFVLSVLFVLALGFTVSLVGSIFKAGVYRAEFELFLEEQEDRN